VRLACTACPRGRKVGKPDVDAADQSSDKKKKKKADSKDKSLAGAPTTAATIVVGCGRGPCGDKQPRQPSGSDEGGSQCLVHNSMHHSTEECREIMKLVEQFCEQ
jgi:hypothetical protein